MPGRARATTPSLDMTDRPPQYYHALETPTRVAVTGDLMGVRIWLSRPWPGGGPGAAVDTNRPDRRIGSVTVRWRSHAARYCAAV